MTYVFMLAIGIGIVAGLRALLAPAIVAWAVHLGWMNLHGSSLAFMGSTAAVVIFTVIAIGELIGDKLPQTPKRTALPSLFVRILMGALCGATLCAAAGESLLPGALSGGFGAVIGTFAGYEIRKCLVTSLHIRDLFVAISEDLISIVLACLVVSR